MSEVAVCNRALQILGEAAIIDLTEDNERARSLTIAYPAVRDSELRKRKWKFSISRASIPALADAPLFGFKNQFQLPVDYLRLLPGGDLVSGPDLSDIRWDSNALYAIEGKRILTSLSAPLRIRYIQRVTDTSLFDPAFAEYLSAKIAVAICDRITQSDSKMQLSVAAAKLALNEARNANALESPSESISDDTWVAARAQ
ncbi:MAG: hypothetical protein U1F35_05425 [Steroidobacteraceae bacterium]